MVILVVAPGIEVPPVRSSDPARTLCISGGDVLERLAQRVLARIGRHGQAGGRRRPGRAPVASLIAGAAAASISVTFSVLKIGRGMPSEADVAPFVVAQVLASVAVVITTFITP